MRHAANKLARTTIIRRNNVRAKPFQAAFNSTSAKKPPPTGKRPVPNAEQIKKLKKVGEKLVETIASRRQEHVAKAWEKASLEQRRKMDDQLLREISRPSKPKTQEQLDFEAPTANGANIDYIDVAASLPDVGLATRPKPGAFVELRRCVQIPHISMLDLMG
jgi:hypothetical protein